MATFIAPASLRAAWRGGVPAALAKQAVEMLPYAKAQKGLFAWQIEGADALFVVFDEAARALPSKTGVVLAFGAADPKGATWKALRGSVLRVTDSKMSAFSLDDPAVGADFDLPMGTYDPAIGDGLVRLKLRAK